jgi:hypothetical protein
LHEHTGKFRKAIKEDQSTHPDGVIRVTKEFEKELHAEVDRMIAQTKNDIATLYKTLDEWSKLKEEQHGKDDNYKAVIETERRYAEILTKSMDQRLDTLNNSFHRLRKR